MIPFTCGEASALWPSQPVTIKDGAVVRSFRHDRTVGSRQLGDALLSALLGRFHRGFERHPVNYRRVRRQTREGRKKPVHYLTPIPPLLRYRPLILSARIDANTRASIGHQHRDHFVPMAPVDAKIRVQRENPRPGRGEDGAGEFSQEQRRGILTWNDEMRLGLPARRILTAFGTI